MAVKLTGGWIAPTYSSGAKPRIRSPAEVLNVSTGQSTRHPELVVGLVLERMLRCERWVSGVRRECVDRLLILGRRHLGETFAAAHLVGDPSRWLIAYFVRCATTSCPPHVGGGHHCLHTGRPLARLLRG